MPTYEYFCVEQEREFEEFHSVNDLLEDCPLCKEKGLQPHKPKRLISGGGKGSIPLKGKEILNQYNNDIKDMQRRVDINNQAASKRK